MKMAVLGCCGFIGSNLVEKLLNEGHEVIGIDNLSLNDTTNIKEFMKHENFTFIKYDITHVSDMGKLFKHRKFDAVFHLAALPRVKYSFEHPIKTLEANVLGTQILLEECKKHKVKRYIYASSSSVYGGANIFPTPETYPTNPTSPYGLHKLMSEHLLRIYHNVYGIETIALRFHNVIGKRQNPEGSYAMLVGNHIKKALLGEDLPVNGDGTIERDFTAVSDVIEAMYLAATTTNENAFGEAFNIGAGGFHSVNEVSNLILKLTNSQSKIVYGPALIEPQKTQCDNTEAKEMLGWVPKQLFEDTIKEEIEYIKRYYTKEKE